jgi:excisionase family DNA binding protein
MNHNPSSFRSFTLRVERLLPVNIVADKLGVSERSVRNFARSGELPAQKVGPKLWRFREIDVTAYVNGRRWRHAR